MTIPWAVRMKKIQSMHDGKLITFRNDGRDLLLALTRYDSKNDLTFALPTTSSSQSQSKFYKINEISNLCDRDAQLVLKAISNFNNSYPLPSLSGADCLNHHLPHFMHRNSFNNKILLYPGSFSPWHRGHLECVLQALSAIDWPMLVVPDCSPWKNHYHKAEEDDYFLWKSFHKLCTSLEDMPVSIYPGFLASRQANPSVDWITQISGMQIALLMGDDTFLNILKWKKSKVLISCLKKILVVPRLATNAAVEAQKNMLLKDFESLEVIILNQHSYQKLSSSKVNLPSK